MLQTPHIILIFAVVCLCVVALFSVAALLKDDILRVLLQMRNRVQGGPAARQEGLPMPARQGRLSGRSPSGEEEQASGGRPSRTGTEDKSSDGFQVPKWLRQLSAGGASDATAGAQLLEEGQAGECAICFEPLWRTGVSVMRHTSGRRVCAHYLCSGCCAAVLHGRTPACPVCRADAKGAKCDAVPDPRKDPLGWFKAVDIAGSGALTRQQVSLALEATLPISRERLQQALDAAVPASEPSNGSCEGRSTGSGRSVGLWQSWCGGPGKDTISQEAFLREGGLLQWVYEHLGELARVKGEPGEDLEIRPEVLIEELLTNPEAWFTRFNVNGGLGLSEGEILRAMMRTFQVSSLEKSTVIRLRQRISTSWRRWDVEGTGRVTLPQFLAPGGLREELIALLSVAATPRESIKAVLKEPKRSISLPKEPEPPPQQPEKKKPGPGKASVKKSQGPTKEGPTEPKGKKTAGQDAPKRAAKLKAKPGPSRAGDSEPSAGGAASSAAPSQAVRSASPTSRQHTSLRSAGGGTSPEGAGASSAAFAEVTSPGAGAPSGATSGRPRVSRHLAGGPGRSSDQL